MEQQHNIYPTTEIDVTTPSYNPGWQCFRFNIHNFESLPVKVDKPLKPIVFSCFGRNFMINLYIGGVSYLGSPNMLVQMVKTSGDPIDIAMRFSANKNTTPKTIIPLPYRGENNS